MKKTLTTTMILSVMFLSAGAFAGGSRHIQHIAFQPAKVANVTVVNKNAAWPPPGHISVEPCAYRRCIDI